MSQQYFSGVGNYIKCESLHKSKISPFSFIKNLTDNQILDIYKNICEISKLSYLHKYDNILEYPNTNKGKYSFNFEVYGQSYYNNMKIFIDKTSDGRSTHWCPEYIKQF